VLKLSLALNMKTIAVIPARGGSKGIPRKSIRPVAGRPMIYYSIAACLQSEAIDEVVVSTDDDEIALLAERFGATVLMRDSSLAQDVTTLDPVVNAVVEQAELFFDVEFDYVYTVQPTSPLIQNHDLDMAAELFRRENSDTVISVVDDRHLSWTIASSQVVPAYAKRVNRQLLPKNYRETGAVIACSRRQLRLGTRIGDTVSLLELPAIRSFDIDNFSDLYLCESILQRKRLVFAVVGYPEVGLGHAYRAVMLANELVNFDLHFLCEEESSMAAEYIRSFNYQVEVCEKGRLVESIKSISPDMVINDLLDTNVAYIDAIKSLGLKVVNFEDLGGGAKSADLVVNALYPHQKSDDSNVLVGPEYFCLREEFLHPPVEIDKAVKNRLLISFGGVDEGDLTSRILKLVIKSYPDLSVDVVVGPGYAHKFNLDRIVASLPSSFDVKIMVNTKRISDYMFNADFSITSAGRTVLELVSTLTPTIAICQNVREMTHTFAAKENGIVNLGYREDVTDGEIVAAISDYLIDSNRKHVISLMKSMDLTKGKNKVINKIKGLLG